MSTKTGYDPRKGYDATKAYEELFLKLSKPSTDPVIPASEWDKINRGDVYVRELKRNFNLHLGNCYLFKKKDSPELFRQGTLVDYEPMRLVDHEKIERNYKLIFSIPSMGGDKIITDPILDNKKLVYDIKECEQAEIPNDAISKSKGGNTRKTRKTRKGRKTKKARKGKRKHLARKTNRRLRRPM